MLIKIFYTLIAFLALGLYSVTNSYDTELVFLDEGKTIKELKENINDLDKTNIELINEFEALNTDYELKSFLRLDLNLVELNKIRLLVSEYNTNKLTINIELYNKAKELLPVVEERKLLLEEKRKFYSGLIPYINIDYKNDYLDYIKGDAKIFNEQNNITTDIIVKREILNTKVETIEGKIKEHKDFINDNIKKVIESKLDEKINNLNNNLTFKSLNKESKIKILDKTIIKVKIKLQNLKNTNIDSSSGALLQSNLNILDKKIQTYYIAVEKLEAFRDSLK